MLQVVFSVERKACHRAQLWQSACIVCEANGQQRAAAGAAYIKRRAHTTYLRSAVVKGHAVIEGMPRARPGSSGQCAQSQCTRLSHAIKKPGSGPLVFVVNNIISSYRMEARGMSRTRGRHGRRRYASERSQEGVSVTTSASSPI